MPFSPREAREGSGVTCPSLLGARRSGASQRGHRLALRRTAKLRGRSPRPVSASSEGTLGHAREMSTKIGRGASRPWVPGTPVMTIREASRRSSSPEPRPLEQARSTPMRRRATRALAVHLPTLSSVANTARHSGTRLVCTAASHVRVGTKTIRISRGQDSAETVQQRRPQVMARQQGITLTAHLHRDQRPHLDSLLWRDQAADACSLAPRRPTERSTVLGPRRGDDRSAEHVAHRSVSRLATTAQPGASA